MIRKFGSCEILEVKHAPRNQRIASLDRFADYDDFRTADGYLYTRVRAISSRVNKNHDGWPAEELAKAYRTFIGKPIFVDHHNSDPQRARGVIVDAKVHVEDLDKVAALDPYYATAPESHRPPTWIELLMETDAKSFPRLAKAVINKEIDGVSMGANVERSKCSHCGNWATSPDEYCQHIRSKGAHFDTYDDHGHKVSKRSYEDCFDIGFFEISYVFDPADETALINEVRSSVYREADRNPLPQSELTIAPDKVDTLRQETTCPICFVPGTLVRTRVGYVPIDTVEPGDEMLTESGYFHRVAEVIESDYDGMLIQVDSALFADPVMMTPKHPIKTLLSRHPKRTKQDRCRPGVCDKAIGFTEAHSLGWSCAEHLTTDSYLVGQTLLDHTEIASVSVPMEFRGKLSRRGPVDFDLTPEFLWAVGLYIAEGNAHNREITFSLHRDEVEYQDRIQRLFEGLGYSTRLQLRDSSKGAWVHVYSSTLAEWFPAWIGQGCAQKRIPAELLNLPDEMLEHVVRGIFDGDGAKKSGKVKQTSSHLALQLAEVGVRRGSPISITKEHQPDRRTAYRSENVLTQLRIKRHAKNCWELEGKPLVRVRSIKEVPYWGPVFNLRVEGDPTYVVQAALVHNCGSDMDNGMCAVCNFEEPPTGFDNPDLQRAKEVDEEVHDQQSQDAAGNVPPDQSQGVGIPPPAMAQPAAMPVAASVTSNGAAPSGVRSGMSTTPHTAAANNGQRINTQERPILPVTRQNSDRPQNARVVSDATKPVESKTQGETMPNKHADGATADGGADVQPKTRVDVTGIGAVDDTPLADIAHENVEKEQNIEAIHTDTWGPSEGDSLGQREPVSDSAGDLITVSNEHTGQEILNENHGEQVDLLTPIAEEVGERTKTWAPGAPDTDMHVGDPVTDENGNEVGGPMGEAIKAPLSRTEVRAHVFKSLRVAETEADLGLIDPETKFERAAELEDSSSDALDAMLTSYAKVRKAGLSKQARKQAGVGRMPSLSKRVAMVDPAQHAVADESLKDMQAFL